jgi:hypothetical protein
LEVSQNIEIQPRKLRCPRCCAGDIVPSKPRGIIDDIMFGMGRVPRHCRSCGKRFYADAARCGIDPAAGEKQKADA